MAETVASSRGFKSVVIAGIATASLLGACTANGNKKHDAAPTSTSSTTAAPTTAVSTPKPTTISQVELVRQYVNSPARNERIATAVHGFGEQVLKASENPANTWAPFDTYCSKPKGPFFKKSWTSKGYEPKSGDDCDVQHNPQYGGANIQIDAQVVVGRDGKYTDTFKGATISTPDCPTVLADSLGHGQWEASRSDRGLAHYESADVAKTLAAAKAVDDFVVTCLNTTTYK